MELNKLILTSRTTEIDTVSGRIISEYEKNEFGSDEYLASVFGLLKAASDRLTTAVKRIKAESALEEKDEIRDSKVRALNYFVMGSRYNPDMQISGAAEAAGKIFDHYGMEVIKESYAVESSLIESLLEEFMKPEMQAQAALLPGLNRLLNDLRTAQTDFEAASLAYENEKAVEGNLENATEIKKEVVSLINDNIVVYLRAMCLSNEAKYGNFSRTVAQIIDDNNTTVKRRTGKQEPAANNVKQ